MDELELTLLSDEDIWGNDSLNVFHKYGTIAAITDLVILTGGYCDDSCTYMVPDDHSLKGRTGWFYTRTASIDGDVRGVDLDGSRGWDDRFKRTGAVRPALLSSSIFSQIFPNRVRGYDGVEEVEYGEYPQYAPDARMQRILTDKYRSGSLLKTGRTYTFDSTEYDYYLQGFQPVKYEEYEYNGKKYIRVKANSDYGDKKFKLSNGKSYRNGNYVWIEVSPVIWLIDDRTKTLVSKRGLLAGIRFQTEKKRYYGHFLGTEMKWYLDNYMVKDLFQSVRTNDKSEKISQIVEEIKQLLSVYYGSEDILGEVDDLINKYNSDVKQIFESKSQGFTLSTNNVDKDFLYAKLVSNLEDVLSKVKASSEKYKEYAKMLDLTKKSISILDGEILEEVTDDLLKDIVTIKQVVLPFLNDKNRVVEIKNIFLEEEKDINAYLRENEDSKIKKYHTLEEFKLGVRKKLQPYLMNLSSEVRNKDLINEIKDGYVKLSNGLFEKSKDDYINYFLDEAKALISEISSRGNDKDKERMKTILANKPKFSDDLVESLTIIVDLYGSLYKILLDIQKREESYRELDDYTIRIGNVKSGK